MTDPECPFCGFRADEYRILLHIEEQHNDDEEPSPFVVADCVSPPVSTRAEAAPTRDGPSSQSSASKSSPPSKVRKGKNEPSDGRYIPCPFKCGELISLEEKQYHMDFHLAENMSFDESADTTSEVIISTGACLDEQALKDFSNYFTSDLPKALRNDGQRQAHTPPETPSHKARSLRDMIFSPLRSQSQPKSLSPSKNVRRLGVSV